MYLKIMTVVGPRQRATQVFGLVALLCALVLLAGCDQLANFCNPMSQTSATVIMQGKADITVPAPVTLNGVSIGEVRGKSLDDGGRAVLKLCLDHDQAEKLDKLTVFYVEHPQQGQQGGDQLVCQIFPDENAPANDDMRFLGFPDYSAFLSWRAQGIVKKGVDSFLKALDDALNPNTAQ